MAAVASIPEHAILLLLVQFFLILGVARLCGELMQRIGQPVVLGEIVGGLLLGPSVLGQYWPAAYSTIFPAEVLSFHLLEIISWLGLIFLLFLVGLGTDVKALHGIGRTAALVTVADFSLTFSSGVVIGYVLPDHFLGFVGNRQVLALFLGIGISITAIPVLAKILLELGMLRRNFGLTALGVGVSEDLFGWLCLPVVLDLAQRGHVAALSIVQALGVTLLFVLGAWGVGRRAVPPLFQMVDHRLKMPHRRVTTAVLLALGCAAITQYIGIHAVFGAFVAGMLVAQAPRFAPADREIFEGFSFGVFSPIFFSFAGLQVRLHEVGEWGIFGMILAVAVAGKLLGAFVGGRLGGMKRIECLAMGIGMNARGSMEVVLALLGLSAGIISQELFSIIVLMAMVTSLMTPPLLRLIAPHIPLGPDEIERARLQAAEAGRIFRKKDLKLLVPTAGGPNAEGILAFASPLLQSGRAAMTFLMIREPSKSFADWFFKLFREDPKGADLENSAERLERLGDERGLRIEPKVVTAESRRDAVLGEALQGYDLLILGAHSNEDPYGGDFLEPVVSDSPAHVAVFRSRTPLPAAFRKILLPTKGDALFPAVFEFAALFGESVENSSITVLYADVARAVPNRWSPLSILLDVAAPPIETSDERSRMTRLIHESIEEHAATTTQTLGVQLKTVSGSNTARMIVQEASSGSYDLIVLGAFKHLMRERLFFGRTVDEIAKRSPCPVIVFTPKREAIERSAGRAP